MIRVVLPQHLRTLAGVSGEVGGRVGRGGAAEVAQVGSDKAESGKACDQLRRPTGAVERVTVDEDNRGAGTGFLEVEGEVGDG